MKQLIICQKKAYASNVDYYDLTKLGEGVLGLFNPSTGELISSASDLVTSFAVACGRGDDKMPLHFPEVNIRNLSVTKAVPQDGTYFTSTITIPTPEKGKEYTVVISKHGVVFNERNNWSYTAYSKNEIAADVAKQIVAQINANSYNSGVKAENTGGAIKITALKVGDNYTVSGADELLGVIPTSTVEGKPAILDKAYVQDLASRCAAGKGFNYLGGDGKEIYPGYPEYVEDTNYVLYSFRFAVPRVAAKQRDEVVFQILHIVVPVGSACIGTLDTIFSLPVTSTTGGVQDIFDIDCGLLDKEDENPPKEEEGEGDS